MAPMWSQPRRTSVEASVPCESVDARRLAAPLSIVISEYFHVPMGACGCVSQRIGGYPGVRPSGSGLKPRAWSALSSAMEGLKAEMFGDLRRSNCPRRPGADAAEEAGRMSHETDYGVSVSNRIRTMARVGVGGRQHELLTKRTPMARKVHVQLIDDLSGQDADETLRFSCGDGATTKLISQQITPPNCAGSWKSTSPTPGASGARQAAVA